MFYIVGLGNPGEEYTATRHNTGRIILADFIKKNCKEGLEFDKKINALVCEGRVGKESFTVIFPETFMNKSGSALKPLMSKLLKKKKVMVKGKKKEVMMAENLIVVHDDIDMPLGKMKMCFNRGSGGHRGVESIMRALKTEAFARIKVGICPATPTGKLKKPDSAKLLDFIVGKFSPKEIEVVKKNSKKVAEALTTTLSESFEKAMSEFN
jgi:PTH1 family peptidyl-tRNA hydrolase